MAHPWGRNRIHVADLFVLAFFAGVFKVCFFKVAFFSGVFGRGFFLLGFFACIHIHERLSENAIIVNEAVDTAALMYVER